uniref:CRAL-TRIO domain-containing protein n=1 Tax=Arion vulgaris TaxID=1028688 RepID=A0A0B6ZFV8_9EUPU
MCLMLVIRPRWALETNRELLSFWRNQEEENQVYGITLLVDYSGFTLSHFARTPPSFARRLCKLWQDVFPARLKSVHIVNEPASFSNIFAIFKPFSNRNYWTEYFFTATNTQTCIRV